MFHCGAKGKEDQKIKLSYVLSEIMRHLLFVEQRNDLSLEPGQNFGPPFHRYWNLSAAVLHALVLAGGCGEVG
ncbi:hypothetical protein LINPERHAP2_LOCUS9852 [Linum perenne]